MTISTIESLPESGYLRLNQIIGDSRKGIKPLIPISRASWYNGIISGKYPKGVRLGLRTTVYRAKDIKDLLDTISNEEVVFMSGRRGGLGTAQQRNERGSGFAFNVINPNRHERRKITTMARKAT